jgi:hypothetical protein
MGSVVLFPAALFFAFDLENFSAFAAYEDEFIITAEDLAADALAAVVALTPYKAAEFTFLSFTNPGRSAFFMLARLFMLAFHAIVAIGHFLLVFHAIVAIGLFLLAFLGITAIGFLIATLFTPIFVHSIHLIRMIRNLYWQGRNYLPISTYF